MKRVGILNNAQKFDRGRGRSHIAGFASWLAIGAAALVPATANAQNAEPANGAGEWTYFPARPQAPEGAPNVMVILTDDVGFSAPSTLGGPIAMPVMDALAADGLVYSRFHVTAMCSPTRAALLTGRNHHAVGYGAIANVAVDEPGYTSVMPKSAATIGRVLRDNGYDTAFFGKNHNTPDWENGPLGPFDNWPNAWGFDYFYGFNGPATDQINPELIENRNPIRRDPSDETYFFERDLADQMIEWLDTQNTLHPDKPFFMYLAPASMHAPQQAPADWIARFDGQFDDGWDVVRERTFARQKELGVIPQDAQLAPLPEGLPRWDSLNRQQKQVYADLMEVAAAQLAFMDHQIGRVIDRLKENGDYDNTLIMYVQGDNGAAMHELEGSSNSYLAFAQIDETAQDLAAHMDKAGGEDSFGSYPAGWAYAMNTPFPWAKTIASHLGGTRNAMVVTWPKAIADRGGVRMQYGHVIDVAPTIYEAVGITPPDQVDGVAQQPIDGISLTYSFSDADAPSRRTEQYYEMLGSRAFYKDGWLASTSVTWKPWEFNGSDPYELPWELYDLNRDFSQVDNLAARHPDKLAELKTAFDAAAERYNVYPLAADYLNRLNPENRPAAMSADAVRTYRPGDTRYPIAAWPNVTRDWQAVARVSTRDADASGPIFVMGMRFTGYGLRLENGVPVFTYDPTGREAERLTLRAPSPLAPGDHEIAIDFVPAGQGVDISMSVDGKEVDRTGSERFFRVFAGNALIGRPMMDDRTGPRSCNCTIDGVTITTR